MAQSGPTDTSAILSALGAKRTYRIVWAATASVVNDPETVLVHTEMPNGSGPKT